jgi:hypothetical protein
MNERIKELAIEARLGPALLLHHYGKVDALTDTEQEELEQLKKFAELIVKECAGVGYDASYYECALNVSNKIKQHFGVEE